jgi:GTP diphosphokinase / guanosine-3',5'-bis(diphosphate) 3'-diphosphatase
MDIFPHHSPFASFLQKIPSSFSEAKMRRALALLASLPSDHCIPYSQGYQSVRHAIDAAESLLTFSSDEDAVLATLLQHLPSFDVSSVDRLEHEFGSTIRDLVVKVSLLSHLYSSTRKQSSADLQQMIISLSGDPRVLFITLSSACVFLDHIDLFPSSLQSKICRYALDIFAPIAARLGMYALKHRLERPSFSRLYTAEHERIAEQLTLIHQEYGLFIHDTALALQEFLIKQGVSARVMAREKQPYSIFCKLRDRASNDPRSIIDLFALRIVVPTLEQCYQSLGFTHHLGTPLSHRFRDYISFPKPNGYQSLHTCLLGLPHAPKDVMVEVQIRTEEMHAEAEYGVAAHWIYKQRSPSSIPAILAAQYSIEDHASSRLVDHIYVLTPNRDIIELPEGSTPLDFAFHLHTDLGLRYRMAKVNGHPVSLSTPLENGDRIEIDVNKHASPSLHWLEVLRTPSARSKLKHYFASHDRGTFIARGKDIVNAELHSRRMHALDADLTLFALFDGAPLPLREREDLLFKIGMGTHRVSALLRHCDAYSAALPSLQRPKKKTSSAPVPPPDQHTLLIAGTRCTFPYRFAQCCTPDQREIRRPLLGTIGRSGLMIVHDATCKMGLSAHIGRRIALDWGSEETS